jgi:hypothetical protein
MMGEWEDKVWGRTRCAHDTLLYSRHELEIVANAFCSYHYHEHRANVFRVIEGRVRVVYTYGWRVLHTDLGPGDLLRMPSLVAHQFQVIESGLMQEDYYPDRGGAVKQDDIIRLSEGGAIPTDFKYPFAPAPIVLLPDGKFWLGRR